MSLHSLLGSSDLEHVVGNIDVRTVVYNYNELDSNHLLTIPVKANTIVLGIGHEVLTAFAGGTPAIDVGDGTVASKFVATADAAPASGGTFTCKLGGTNGKKYTNAGNIVVTGSASLTAGKGKLYIFELNLDGNGRIPAL